jgi:PAS domain S-box-containing protein
MSLRTRTLLITGSVALVLLLALSFSSRLAVLRGFEDVEMEAALVDVRRVHSEIADVLEHIRSIGGDWGPWDDTYEFVAGLENEYIRKNLSDETVANLNLHFMAFVGPGERLVHVKYLEMVDGQGIEAPMPREWLEALLARPDLVRRETPEDYRLGVVAVGEAYLLVASYPIMKSNSVGPVVGALICGSRLDEALIQRIAEKTHLGLSLRRQADLPAEDGVPCEPHGRVWLRKHEGQRMTALTELRDLDGQRAAWLEIGMDRRIYRQGLLTWRYNVISLLLLGVVFVIGLLLYLERTVLVRLGRVHGAVRAIAHSGDASQRVPPEGSDELGELAAGVNGMLATLEQAHARRVAAEARYRAIVDSQMEMICRTDEQGRLTFVNDAFARALGESVAALLGRPLESLPVVEIDWGLAQMRAALRRENQVTMENRLVLPGGERWQLWTHRAIHDANGCLVEYQSVGRDITERRRAEIALRQNQDYLRALLDSIHCGVLVVEASSRRILDLNAAAAALVGLSRDQILGQVCNNFICPADPGQSLVPDGGWALDMTEWRLIRADGSEMPILKSVASVEREGRHLLIESFIDLRPRKQMEADLRASERRYREFFEQDLTGDFISTPDGRILDCNIALARILGYDSVAAMKTVNLTAFYHRPEEYAQLLQALKFSGRLEGYRSELRNRQAQPIHLVGNIIGHFDEAGELKALQGYLYDETQRILLERHLRQAHKMEALGTLAGGIAHDFNNILSAVLGFSELALMNLSNAQAVGTNLENVVRAGRRASELVKQILAYSRRADQELTPVKVHLIVEEALKLLRPSLPASIEIDAHLPKDAGCVLADPTQLHQIVMNLCTNAAHAMRKTSGRLEIRLQREDVSASAERLRRHLSPGSYLKLTVADTGHGIPPEMLELIFDPYFTTKEKGEGTGMGLSVVQGIVRSYRGAVLVDSLPGAGSTFQVYLPLAAEGPDVPLLDCQQPLPRGGERVMVVDDEPDVADVTGQRLTRWGYEVTICTDSREALERFRRSPGQFDLVVTDQTMPHLNGDLLGREMLRLRPDLPVIVCTGFSKTLSEETALAMGFRAFLAKPLSARALAQTVRRVLDQASPCPCAPMPIRLWIASASGRLDPPIKSGYR